jgi:hypothetical protein
MLEKIPCLKITTWWFYKALRFGALDFCNFGIFWYVREFFGSATSVDPGQLKGKHMKLSDILGKDLSDKIYSIEKLRIYSLTSRL